MIKSRRSPDLPVRLGSIYDRNLNQYNHISTGKLEFYSERVDTTNHPGWFTQGDGGGFFDLQRSTYRVIPSAQVRCSGNAYISYDGKFVTSIPSGTMPLGDGHEWGAIAWDRMRPDRPPYSLLNMVYELKDLGHMFHSLKNFWSLEQFKRPGGFWREGSNRFLGQLFGWNPLVNDVITVAEKYTEVNKRIQWLIRNEGKWVNRKIEIRDSSTLTQSDWVDDWGALAPVLTTQHYIRKPRRRDSRYVKDKIWATAQFKYFLPTVPKGPDLEWLLKKQYLGIRAPTFADIYRAVPWTWLIDWCFNYSLVLANMGPGLAERLAARRFYIMREQEVISIRQANAVMRGYGGGPAVPIDSTAWRSDIHKTRTIGLPFYPGNPNQLSGLQQAILAALGMSRLP